MNRMLAMSALLGALALTAVAPASAGAATRYASPTGLGALCTQASPCSIITAINAAGSGEEVILAGDQGSYGTPGAPISSTLTTSVAGRIHGADGQPMPIIYSNAGPYALLSTSSARLDHLRVEQVGGSGALFSTGATDHVIAHGGNAACTFTPNNQTISNTACAGGAYGIFFSSSCPCSPLTMTYRNVTAYGTQFGASMFVSNFQLTVTATNSIFQGLSVADIETTRAGTSTGLFVNLDHSNYNTTTPNAGTTITTPGTGTNQTAAPIFVDPTAGMAPISPTINVGANDAANETTDVNGAPRIVQGVTDIGAFEYLPAPNADTGATNGVAPTSANITGNVNPNGQATSYKFEWGDTTAHGSSSATQITGVEVDPQPVTATLTGLSPGKVYHYRLVATNATGTTAGADKTFTAGSAFRGVEFVGSRAAVKRGAAQVKLRCRSETAIGKCSGKLTLAATARTAAKKAIKLGSKTFTIEPGKTGTVKVKLSRKVKRQLAKQRKLKVRASAIARDAANVDFTVTRGITLKPAR